MPKNRIKPEHTIQLSNGTVVYINQLGDMYGSQCFLVTTATGLFGSFVITADGIPLNGERFTPEQQKIVPQIKKVIAEIIGN